MYPPNDVERHRSKDLSKSQDFLVLGSQPLSALADRITCSKVNQLDENGVSTGSHCFFIEAVLYEDLRGDLKSCVVSR